MRLNAPPNYVVFVAGTASCCHSLLDQSLATSMTAKMRLYKLQVIIWMILGFKMSVFWVGAPCSAEEVQRRYRDAYCLPPQDRHDDGGNEHF
jgi:hypothetical protein